MIPTCKDEQEGGGFRKLQACQAAHSWGSSWSSSSQVPSQQLQDKQGFRPSQHTFGSCPACQVIPFCDRVTCLGGEGKAVDESVWTLGKALISFPQHSHEKLDVHGLDRCTLSWVDNWLHGQTLRVVVNWGQFGLVSAWLMWTEEWRAPSASLQKDTKLGGSADVLEGSAGGSGQAEAWIRDCVATGAGPTCTGHW